MGLARDLPTYVGWGYPHKPVIVCRDLGVAPFGTGLSPLHCILLRSSLEAVPPGLRL